MKHAYPDAFCLKCKAQTPTVRKNTVILSNSARAVSGECQKCGSPVYKIIPPKSAAPTRTSPKPANVVSLNHGSWLSNHGGFSRAMNSNSNYASQASFVFGVATGVLIMLGVIVARVYF